MYKLCSKVNTFVVEEGTYKTHKCFILKNINKDYMKNVLLYFEKYKKISIYEISKIKTNKFVLLGLEYNKKFNIIFDNEIIVYPTRSRDKSIIEDIFVDFFINYKEEKTNYYEDENREFDDDINKISYKNRSSLLDVRWG